MKTLSSKELGPLIESKRKEIQRLKDELRPMVVEMKLRKKEESAAKKNAEIAGSAQVFSGIWAKIALSGLNAKQVVALQNPDIAARQLGAIIGVGASRARQIREIAYRKMRHRDRIAMVDSLDASVHFAVYGEERPT